MASKKETFALYVRTFVFGVEDSLVSTVGLLSGVALAGASRNTILLSGSILIFVEAFSMGVGSLLSEHQAEKYLARRDVPILHSAIAGVLMFISYLGAGLIPLAPYLYYENHTAVILSIAFASHAKGRRFNPYKAHHGIKKGYRFNNLVALKSGDLVQIVCMRDSNIILINLSM